MPAIRSQSRRPQTLWPRSSLELSVGEYYSRRNRVLVFRGVGGLGDILMHRMLFEDMKLLCPDAEIFFACPPAYHDAVQDHPHLSGVLSPSEVNHASYFVCYNTTSACGRREMRLAPRPAEHRSDIWAAQCGFTLTRHEMHIRLTEQEKAEGRRLIEENRERPGPVIIFSPVSAIEHKNLLTWQVTQIATGLREQGLCPIGLHTGLVQGLLDAEVPTIRAIKLRQWLAVLDQADYVLSVDSAAFHGAGGLKRPVVGVFTFANAASYGRYYPTAEFVQGPCPLGHAGCYNWTLCPAGVKQLKPCLTGLDPVAILNTVARLTRKYPWGRSNYCE